jgi:hypothetical protein
MLFCYFGHPIYYPLLIRCDFHARSREPQVSPMESSLSTDKVISVDYEHNEMTYSVKCST